MTAATLYAHYDASAPQFTSTSSTAGELYYILKAVLINGYGSKTPVGGWTLAYDDEPNKTLVLKQNGEDRYIRIDDGQNYQWATLLYFDSMSDVDTGTNQVPSPAALGSNKYFVGKRSSTSYNSWHMLVADDGSFVYFFTKEANYDTGFFFGMLDNEDEAQRRFATTGYLSTSISTTLFPQCLYTSPAIFVERDRYDTGNAEKCTYYLDSTSFSQPNPVDGKLVIQKYSVVSSVTPYAYFGSLPNLTAGLGTTSGFFTEGTPITIDGDDYVYIQYGKGYFFSLS